MRISVFTPVIAAWLATSSLLSAAAPSLEKIDLFTSGEDGYALYRIPGIVVTKKGTVLAYNEARREGKSDWDTIDIMLRRSTDDGKTWSLPHVIAHHGPSVPRNPVTVERHQGQPTDVTVNNAVMVADRESGSIHFIYCVEYSRCFYSRSDDEGRTFSSPVDLTATFDQFRPQYPWRVIATGPGHGIQLQNGRLVVPVWLSLGTESNGHKPSVAATIYSDDYGVTWHRGAIALPNTEAASSPSETAVVQLADGRVLLNSRSLTRSNRRLVTLSPDGATGWTPPHFDDALLEPQCMASIVRYSAIPAADRNRILFSNPDNLSRAHGPTGPGLPGDRKNLSIKLSYDEAETWPVHKALEPDWSGYSDLAVARDGTILCFYERGSRDGQSSTQTGRLTVARFNLEWLTDGKDSTPHGDRVAAPKAGEPVMVPMAETIRIGDTPVDLRRPPAGLVLHPELGLLLSAPVSGQLIHRAPAGMVLETRATLTPEGDYLLMFPEGQHYGGSKGQKVNRLLAYRSSDRGRTWRGPTDPFAINYSQHGFIPLIPRGTKRIYCFGTQPISGKYDWGHGQAENAPIGFRWSDDDGFTWSEVTLIAPVNDPQFKGMSVMRMCETDSGVWLLGSHSSNVALHPITTRQYLLRSEDRGKTWTVLPDRQPNGWYAAGYNRMDEGRPISLGGSKVLFMSRTTQGHLFTAWSDDDGRTWTQPAPSVLVQPDAPPMLFALSDGKTLAAFHHNGRRRSEIWVSTSTDGGHSWTEPRFVLANAAAPNLENAWRNEQCSYLDAFTDGGILHLFMPHRWQQALYLTIAEADLARLPTRSELGL